MGDFVPEEPEPSSFDGADINDLADENTAENKGAAEAESNAQETGSDVDKQRAEAAKEKQAAANKKLVSKVAQTVGDMDPGEADKGVDEIVDMLDGLEPDNPSATQEAVKKLSPSATKVMESIADTSQTLNDGLEKQAKKAGKSAEYSDKLESLRKAQIDYIKSYMADGETVSDETANARDTFNESLRDMKEMIESISDPEKLIAEDGGVEASKESMASKLASLLMNPALWKTLGLFGALVGIALLLKSLAKSETGCYLVQIQGNSSKDSYTKIENPDEDHKNCCVCYDGGCSGKTDLGCDAQYTPVCANSANPKCAGVVGSSGSIYYTWQTVTPAQVLAGIPGAVIDEVGKVAKDAAGLFLGLGMKVWIGIIVGIVVLIVVVTLAVHFARRKKTK